MKMLIKKIVEPAELEKCFPVFKELRPNLENSQIFTDLVIRQWQEGYQIVAGIIDGDVVGCIGYRVMNLLASGKILYIDDLITSSKFRKHGCGKELLEYAINYAKELSCDQVHLDSGYTRYDAHRLYLNHGFQLVFHHLAKTLT